MSNPLDSPVRKRALSFGEEISSWPQKKKAHALSVLEELDRRVAEWEARELIVTAPRLTADSMTVEFDLHVREQPPLDEWSLLFADAVHALRSSLDALAWEIATLDGNRPAKPNQVYFPIGGQGFDAKMKAIGPGIDPEFIERFRALQQPAFVLSGPGGEVDILGVLHQLDIDDKHRGALRAEAQLGSANVAARVYFDAGTEVKVEKIDGEVLLEHGSTVARMLASKPARLEPTAPVPIRLALSVRYEVDGEDYRVSLPTFVATASAAVEHAQRVMTEGESDGVQRDGR